MARVLRYLPEIEGDEQIHVARLMKPMTDDEAEEFSHAYRQRRKDPKLTLAATLLAFAGIAGIERFYVDQVFLGILYLLTAGLCFIGTVIDLINYKGITYEYNRKLARDVAAMVGHKPERRW